MEFDWGSELRDPAVLVGFSGWNDAGNAASDTLRHILDTYPNDDFGVIDDERYYDFQATRPNIFQSPDGPYLQWPHTSVKLVHHPDRDFLIVVGPEPSLLWRSFTSELVGRIASVTPSVVVMLGGMLSDTPHTRPLPVSAYTSDPGLRAHLSAEAPSYEGPTGIVGVVNQALASRNLPTVSLWVNVPHYVSNPPNPKAQLALFRQLELALGVTFDVDAVEVEAQKWAEAVDELSADDPDVAEYIEQLEEAKDASDAEEATGDQIAKEFERYLRGRGDGAAS